MDLNVIASLTKHKRTTLERIEKFISDTYFTDVNLYGKLYPYRTEVSKISHWPVPGGEGSWESWSMEQIKKQEFTPAKIGDSFGPSWSTHWFKVEITVPEEWTNKEVRFRWKSQSESMIWSPSGRPLQGLSSGTGHQMRTDYCLSKSWNPEEAEKHQIYFIEMSCSRMFGLGKGGMINPPNNDEKFTLEMAELCVFDREAFSLLVDLEVLHDIAKHVAEDQRGYRALYAGNQIVNYIIADNLSLAKEVSQNYFSSKNGDSALTLALIGNCHIDSAWLWPYSETKRKCARSWASTIGLMDDYEEMVFACSQAQQILWVKTYYPDLYQDILSKSKEGKFIHVGSTWVEMDGLIPGGESFMRQFLYGQKFYRDEFGSASNIFWLPDTFGYSGQIPQICQHFGVPYFLTQKLSWNLVNKFPHHTFMWEGIDGSSVLTHFPPGDSYEMNVKAEEAIRTEKNLSDKGRVSLAAFLYGYGDGGGGPTENMLERAKRLKNVDGCPRLEHMSPVTMFDRMKKEKRNLCRWVGELYLELHNGTYTSQANTKLQNRKCEFELRNIEILLSMVASFHLDSPENVTRKRNECEETWKKVLLNQFHDVLPGSSIGMVYKDSDKLYREALENCANIKKYALQKLSESETEEDKELHSVINFLPWFVSQIIEVENIHVDDKLDVNIRQKSSKNGHKSYIAVKAPPMSYTRLNVNSFADYSALDGALKETQILKPPSVTVCKTEMGVTIRNRFLSATFTNYGQLSSLINTEKGSHDIFELQRRDSTGLGNLLTIYDDVPLFWDAWDVMDYHIESRRVLNSKENEGKLSPLVDVENGPLRAELQFSLSFGSKGSSLVQRIVMTAVDPFLTVENEVDWKESHKFLKVEFETGILAREATYEIQFGHIRRPTHQNTSWDWAKFEVCGHKWANISEEGRGLSLLNNCKYGWSARGGTLALSLLRAPKSPDDDCDMGKHFFRYGVLPHRGSLQESRTMEASYEFNSKLTLVQGRPRGGGIGSWLKVLSKGVMLEAAKVSEADPDTVVVRLYEMYGGTRTVWLKSDLQLHEAWISNGLEESLFPLHLTPNFPEEELEGCSTNGTFIHLSFGPFQIQTILLKFQ